MAILTPLRHRFYNNDGTLAAGGKVYTYIAGTTTLKTSYTDSTGSVANANPIILNSKGECDLWTSGLYKINVTQSDDTQITGYPVDNIGAGQSSYDIAGFLSGIPTASQILLRLPMVRQVTFDVNMAGSKGASSVAATASTTFTIAKNGVSIGTMVFAIGATTATFVAASATTFAIGDVLSVTGPNPADVTLANVGFVLAGNITP